MFVIEIDPELSNKLNLKYKKNKNVNILNLDIRDIDEDGFDYVVCSLPFNSFDEVLNRDIMNKIKHIVNKGALNCS